jgi:predicted ATPase
MLTRLAVCGYRSLRALTVELSRLNVVCGANGVGKSSLYRAIRLLAETAQGEAILDSMLTHCADTTKARDLLLLREHMRNWRFYDHFRTDPHAPARRPQIGTLTPILASDGADLAAAVQTIVEIGDREAFKGAIEDAFPGATVEITANDGLFSLKMRQHGLLRPLSSADLSDGTLRYLLLLVALLTPRPPQLMVLNEPETSLHPDLLRPLARLIAGASETMQIIVVTHAADLARELLRHDPEGAIRLSKSFGETIVEERTAPNWRWPER